MRLGIKQINLPMFVCITKFMVVLRAFKTLPQEKHFVNNYKMCKETFFICGFLHLFAPSSLLFFPFE